jgi:hypothetical protein
MARQREVWGLAALVAAALIASPGCAQGWAPPPPPRYGRMPPPAYYGGPPPGYYRGVPPPLPRTLPPPPPRRFRRCRDDGGSTIIGAIAGGLLGNMIAGRGNRGVGTVAGAGVGAFAGREAGRDCR